MRYAVGDIHFLSPKKYLATGTVGGLIMPDNEMSFSFNAGKGHYLSFATMFVQSNDLFYGFGDTRRPDSKAKGL